MELKTLFVATWAALLAFSTAAFAQTQSGSSIRSDSGLSAPATGSSADTAGSAGSTAPRTPDTTNSPATTSVGTSGATSSAGPTRTSGLCDTLTGDERVKCLREQVSTGTAGGSSSTGTSGAGSTGMGSGAK